jgi:hypothetical protein
MATVQKKTTPSRTREFQAALRNLRKEIDAGNVTVEQVDWFRKLNNLQRAGLVAKNRPLGNPPRPLAPPPGTTFEG